MWLPVGVQPVALEYQEVEKLLGLGSELDALRDFCQKMNFLIYIANTGFQFKNSNYRDYCVCSGVYQTTPS